VAVVPLFPPQHAGMEDQHQHATDRRDHTRLFNNDEERGGFFLPMALEALVRPRVQARATNADTLLIDRVTPAPLNAVL